MVHQRYDVAASNIARGSLRVPRLKALDPKTHGLYLIAIAHRFNHNLITGYQDPLQIEGLQLLVQSQELGCR